MSNGRLTALLFEVAHQRYGLDVSEILEVVPAVPLRSLPSVPAAVAGVFCYRGAIVPVLDLSQMLGGMPASKRFSTRVVLVRYAKAPGAENVLGLLVEGATHGLAEGITGLMPSGVKTPEAPYLGKIGTRGDETVQLLKIDELIPEALRERLFCET